MNLVKGKMNPTMYWGVLGKGFKYGRNVLMSPDDHEPVLAVIDSGTTLMILPSKIFDSLMNKIADRFKDDHDVTMICSRKADTNAIEVCYFNNTKCSTLYKKVEPIEFLFDKTVFELQSPGFLKDDLNLVEETRQRVPACVVDIRGANDEQNPEEKRFLMGNTFLKNFYSVYDYDWQQVRLGVNIHSKDWAKVS